MSAASALKALLAFKFEVVTGGQAGQQFIFDKARVGLGRGEDNDVVLLQDPKISRHHAEIKYSNGEFRIYNLSQKNFTLVNGRKVDNYLINFGDKIQIGDTEIKFGLVQQAQAPIDDSSKTLVTPNRPMPVKANAPQVVLTPTAPQPRPMAAPSMAPPYMGGPPPTAMPYPSSRSGGGMDTGRSRFYMILAVVGVVVYFLFFSGNKKKSQEIRFDAAPTIQQEIANAENLKKAFEEKNSKMQTAQAQRADENFTKGFRDYMQGQYGRAREHFQVVLTLDPEHQEARRYLTLSKLKFDEQVKRHLQQGRIYFENRNYRRCRASFETAMTMLSHNPNDPSYVDAKKFFEACDLALGGR